MEHEESQVQLSESIKPFWHAQELSNFRYLTDGHYEQFVSPDPVQVKHVGWQSKANYNS